MRPLAGYLCHFCFHLKPFHNHAVLRGAIFVPVPPSHPPPLFLGAHLPEKGSGKILPKNKFVTKKMMRSSAPLLAFFGVLSLLADPCVGFSTASVKGLELKSSPLAGCTLRPSSSVRGNSNLVNGPYPAELCWHSFGAVVPLIFSSNSLSALYATSGNRSTCPSMDVRDRARAQSTSSFPPARNAFRVPSSSLYHLCNPCDSTQHSRSASDPGFLVSAGVNLHGEGSQGFQPPGHAEEHPQDCLHHWVGPRPFRRRWRRKEVCRRA